MGGDMAIPKCPGMSSLPLYMNPSGSKHFTQWVSEVQPRYQPGGPIIHRVQNVVGELGMACGSLEKYYNANLKKPQSEQEGGLYVSFKPKVFQHAGMPYFEVC